MERLVTLDLFQIGRALVLSLIELKRDIGEHRRTAQTVGKLPRRGKSVNTIPQVEAFSAPYRVCGTLFI